MVRTQNPAFFHEYDGGQFHLTRWAIFMAGGISPRGLKLRLIIGPPLDHAPSLNFD